MPQIEEIKQELEQLQAVQFISSALVDISAQRIKNIRKLFERNHDFYNEIAEVYALVRRQAVSHGVFIHEHRQIERNEMLNVAVTSNSRFYGSLNRDVMDKFVRDSNERGGDRLVIGRTGETYLDRTGEKSGVKFMFFEDDYPTEDNTRRFLEETRQYESVFIYYPKFVNLFDQTVISLDITYVPEPGESAEVPPKYIFEPELPKMMDFFETQVRHILFSRVMLEASLSRAAARMTRMHNSESKADSMIDDTRNKLRKKEAQVENIHLLDSIAGIKSIKDKN